MQWWLVSEKQGAYFLNSPFAMLHGTLIRVLTWFVATRRGRVIHLLSVPWLLLLAWLTSVAWFLTDDAFISFRYVRNLLEGHGLVFNPGEYVEGDTNFLWILELAALWGLFGLRPEHATNWLSVAYTGGTLAALWWWLARSLTRHDRGFLAWLALGLLGSSATFAVWTSGGGLETRQFTCFIVVAVVCLAVHRNQRWGLVAASLSLAAAALTRPEGLLLAACCFGWFAAQRLVHARHAAPGSPGRDDSIAALLAAVVRRLDWRELVYLVAPFAIVVATHFLWRYGYYGEWLPNTYYAKHIRPWYESGFRHLWAAALETGLYLLLPLTWVALRARWREHRDGTYALVLLCIGAHLYYLLRIGGAHFEYRPLDFYWPLLALPAAEGLAYLGARVAAGLQWMRWRSSYRCCATPARFRVACYMKKLPTLNATRKTPGGCWRCRGCRRWWPSPTTCAASPPDSMSAFASEDTAISPTGGYGNGNPWQPYEGPLHGVIPDDAVMARGGIGITPYYVQALTIIDTHGLTDATVARNPVTRLNYERSMAHDRRPPPGYLQQRGANFHAYPAATSANYALPVGPELWMPFDVADHQWANERFASHDLRARHRFALTDPADNRFHVGSHHYVGTQFLGRFESGLDGWRLTGEAVTNRRDHAFYGGQDPIFGHVGPGFLTSYHPDAGNQPTGTARSPEFTAADGHHLALLIGGGSEKHNVGVRLLAGGKAIAVWRSRYTEYFKLIVHPLAEVAGQSLQLELFDDDPEGHIMLDHVLLVRESDPAPRSADAGPKAG